jgi:NitT/TauT family transport system ATP-binding protein
MNWQPAIGDYNGIDEALTLGTHVAVMSARPGRIREIIPIDLARPGDITSPQFNETKRHILDLLRSERTSPSPETLDHP